MARDIAVTLTSDTRNFSKGLQSARSDLSLLGTSIKAAGAAVAGFLAFQTIKAGFGVLTDTIGKLDDLAAQAERLGVSTEFLSEIQHAAKLSDTEIEALNGGLEKLEKNLGKATLEGGQLTETLARFGLDAAALAEAGPEEAFLQIADAVSRIPDPMRRAAVVTDLFGKSGQSLTGILSKGRDEITALREEARALGVSLSGETAERIGQADDAMKRFDSAMMGLKTTIAIELVPAFTDMVNYLSYNVMPAIGKIRSEIEQTRESLSDLWKLLKAGPISLFPGSAMGTLRKDRLPKGGGGAAQPLEIVPILGEPGAFPSKAGAPGGDAMVAELVKEFKSFARPLALESKEGFSTLARAMTKQSADPIANKQLAEAKIANKHLGNIEDGLKNLPKVAPAF